MSIAREPGKPRIYTEDRPRRHPPVSESGIIGWIRHNLFATPLDAFLTLAAAYIVYSALSGAILWSVHDANWFAITRNLSLFMLGPLQADAGAVFNIQIMTLLLAFAVGLSFAAWAHIGLRSWAALAVIGLLCAVTPVVVSSTIPLPGAILSAGNASISAGSVNETPTESIAFIANAGETVTVRLANDPGSGDLALTEVAAFTDRATDALISASRARITGLARLEELTARLDDPNIASTERARILPEFETLTTSTATAVNDAYGINSAVVTVRISTGDLSTVLGEAVLTPESAEISLTIPESGWYVLDKVVEGGSVALIDAHGIYPLLERQFTQPVRDASGEIVLGVNGLPRQETVTQYLRITDDLLIDTIPPQREGSDVQRFLVIDNQYRGLRPLGDFLVLHVGPFLERLSLALIPCLAAFAAGYLGGVVSNTYVQPLIVSVSTRLKSLVPTQFVSGFMTGWVGRIARFIPQVIRQQWAWLLLLLIISLIVYRTSTDLDHLNGLATDPVALQQASLNHHLNAFFVSAFTVGLAFISVNMLAPATGIPYARRVISWLWFVMPFAIFFLVAGSDLGRWGGLFLTFMLTAVGIVASFPIGVLLALGRRADGLPVIKYLCIAFIELVRGVPLITVLFLASLALPLVSPALSTVPQAVRAMVAITLFSAAYLAENVRGGLQSIPHGQTEAARALGMNPVQVTVFITLPQALRAVIPALVGQCIALFKDTSLVAIVGLLDLTKNADSVVAQAEYIGLRREAYIFISIVYFVFSYAMAYVSRKLEQSGSGRARQINL